MTSCVAHERDRFLFAGSSTVVLRAIRLRIMRVFFSHLVATRRRLLGAESGDSDGRGAPADGLCVVHDLAVQHVGGRPGADQAAQLRLAPR